MSRIRPRHAATLAATTVAVSAAIAVPLAVSGAPPTAAPNPPLQGTTWRLQATSPARDLDRINATLIIQSGRISGYDGCNSFDGRIHIGQRTWRTQNLITTTRACLTDTRVQRAVGAEPARWTIQSGLLQVAGGGVTATYRRQPPSGPPALRNTRWRLTGTMTYDHRDGLGHPTAASGVTVAFGRDRMSGAIGCRTFTGPVRIAEHAFAPGRLVRGRAGPCHLVLLRGQVLAERMLHGQPGWRTYQNTLTVALDADHELNFVAVR